MVKQYDQKRSGVGLGDNVKSKLGRGILENHLNSSPSFMAKEKNLFEIESVRCLNLIDLTVRTLLPWRLKQAGPNILAR